MARNTMVLRARADEPSIDVRAEVDLDAGGRIRQITLDTANDSVELLAATTVTDPASTGWGSFPMAPWAGRIRHGLSLIHI